MKIARIEVGADRRAAAPFGKNGEFFSSVMNAAVHRAANREYLVDPRLVAAAGSDDNATYSDPAGGFLIPQTLAPIQLAVPAEDDPAAGRTLPVPMLTPHVAVNARTDKDHTSSVSGGLVFARRAEATAAVASRQAMEHVILDAVEGFGFAWATEELVTDSAPSIVTVLEASFRDEAAGLFLDERLNGSGVGEFLGILNPRNTALITVDKEAGQSNATILGENIAKMRARCWGYRRAVWIANHDAYLQIQRATVDIGGVNRPVWQAGISEEGAPDLVLGRPLFLSEFCQTLGSVGDIVLVDWSQYLDGTYQPFTGMSSIHVRWSEHERAFKFWVRNAGTPWWRSPLTPKRSTVTLSPYLTLKARS